MKNIYVKKGLIVCVLAIVLVFVGCSDKESEKLLGRWRSSGGGIEITFNEDGTLKYNNIGNPIQYATWRISDEELTLDFSGKVTIYTYSVTEEMLVMKVGEQTIKWYR